MKKLITFAFITICGLSYSQDSNLYPVDTFYNLKDQISEITYEDGSYLDFSYYRNNNIKWKTYYYSVEGIQFSKVEYYLKNGTLSERSYYYTKDRKFFGKEIAHGPWHLYDTNGILQLAAFYKDNKLEGTYTEFYKSGKVKEISKYKNDKANGPATAFYEDHKPKSLGYYTNDKMDKEWNYYYPSGKKSAKLVFVNKRLMKADYYDEEGHLLHNPDFKDGDGTLINYDNGMVDRVCKIKKGKVKKCWCD